MINEREGRAVMNDAVVQEILGLERQKLAIQFARTEAMMDDRIESSHKRIAAAMADVVAAAAADVVGDVVSKAVAKLQQDILSTQILLRTDIKVIGLELKSDIARLDDRITRVEERVIHVEGRVTEIEERLAADINRLERKLGDDIARAERKLSGDIARVEQKPSSDIACVDGILDRHILDRHTEECGN
ncbi:hypothetical protein J5X84_09920 [Streptosporangiaceae bacterium NEAU-GS5]|nr:hypothetical protein [Streptosporangiaceae bacterium NEAU-GS5]